MKNFENLAALIEKEINKYQETALAHIETGHQYDADAGLKNASTDTRWSQYQAGKITRETAVELAKARTRKQYKKQLEKKLSRLETVAAAPALEIVEISVEWKRNPYWGMNPTASVEIKTAQGWEFYSGRASGCGYDKETAAIAEALDKCNSVLQMLYTKKETALAANPAALEDSNRNLIAYGAGYGALPYFEGGVGMSSFESVFNACGYRLTHQHHTKTTDYYFFEKVQISA